MTNTPVKAKIKGLCYTVAATVYPKLPPSYRYADYTARLLFMTAAHESDSFRARRQYGFNANTLGGAFSFWQMEKTAIKEALQWIEKNFDAAQRIRKLLQPEDLQAVRSGYRAVLKRIQTSDGDMLACILARIYYLQKPGAIPSTNIERARYAKKYWNTEMGKADYLDYANAFTRLW